MSGLPAELSPQREFIDAACESCLVLEEDFWDEALVGYVEKIDFGPVACYDWDKLVEVATKEFGDQERALEHLDFNVLNSLGHLESPVVLYRPGGMY
tara:strand:- start:1997 stop:2287 length:291 start_codon:yes stop_codon:yes gene_type:complete